jgi:hypothetical protein
MSGPSFIWMRGLDPQGRAFERAAKLSESEPACGRRLAAAPRAAFVAGQVERAGVDLGEPVPA